VRITDFNTDGHPHADLVSGLRSVPSDNAWNAAAPEGTAEALGFIQVDFSAVENAAPLNYLVKLSFERVSQE
jgi:hypothetical protein